MRVFVSYHSPDFASASEMRTALGVRKPDLDFYFAPVRNTLGAYWLPRLSEELEAADAMLLILGEKVGPWQELEYYEAMRLSRRRSDGRPLVVPLVIAKAAPGLPFLNQLHQVFVNGQPRDEIVRAVLTAFDGVTIFDQPPAWARYDPYKGLEALGSGDAAFFFGREAETGTILQAVRDRPDRVLTLIGNSGVGKSSLAQAGVLASLRSQIWMGALDRPWPSDLANSRTWLPVKVVPGERPLEELSKSLIKPWWSGSSFDLDKEAAGWADRFREGRPLEALTSIAFEKIAEQNHEPPPKRFILYIDQSEELYARAEPKHARRLSELLAAAATRPDVIILTSLRSDYYGRLQADEPLFAATERIDVPPLSEHQIDAVIRRPAATLGARFEHEEIVPLIAASAAREPGSLPLLSYLLTDAWAAMRADPDASGVLKFPLEVVDVSRPLANRAEAFLDAHPGIETKLKRIFSLRLAHVPIEGEPVRRRAARDEFNDEEWGLVESLAGPEWRLITTGGDEHDVAAEVAHEALLRKWPRLTGWLEEEREFLVWKGQTELARREWETTPEDQKNGALIMGRRLDVARGWIAARRCDLADSDLQFVEASIAADVKDRSAKQRWRTIGLCGSLAAAIFLGLGAILATWQWQRAEQNALNAIRAEQIAENRKVEAEKQKARAVSESVVARREKRLATRSAVAALAALSRNELERGNPKKGAMLALASWPRRGASDLPQLPSTELAIVSSGFALGLGHKKLPLPANSFGFSTSKNFAIIIGPDDVYVFNLRTQDVVRRIQIENEDPESVALTIDEETIAVGYHSGLLAVFNTQDGRKIREFRPHTEPIDDIAFLPTNNLMATASRDRSGRVINFDSGAVIATFRNKYRVASVAVSADGKKIAFGAGTGFITVWSLDNVSLLESVRLYRGTIHDLSFSQDGQSLLVASGDTKAAIIQIGQKEPSVVFRGHNDSVFSARFSQDEAYVVTASRDHTARLWDARSGKELFLFPHGRWVYGGAFVGEDLEILTTSFRNSGIWSLKELVSNQLFEKMCQLTPDHGLDGFMADLEIRLESAICTGEEPLPDLQRFMQ